MLVEWKSWVKSNAQIENFENALKYNIIYGIIIYNWIAIPGKRHYFELTHQYLTVIYFDYTKQIGSVVKSFWRITEPECNFIKRKIFKSSEKSNYLEIGKYKSLMNS